MNVEIEAEAAIFPEKEYINGIAVAVRTSLLLRELHTEVRTFLYYIPTWYFWEAHILSWLVSKTISNIFWVFRNAFLEENNLKAFYLFLSGSKIPVTILLSVSCSVAVTIRRTVAELVFTLSQVMYCIHSKPCFLSVKISYFKLSKQEAGADYSAHWLWTVLFSFNPFAGYFLLVHIKIGIMP